MAVTRYPGVTSFQDTDLGRMLFFGREEEGRRLLYFILGDALTVLYSKSGYGKTSLLQAKVFGLLRQHQCYPVFIRFNQKDLSPAEVIKYAIRDSQQQGYEVIDDPDKQTLKEFFGALEIWSADNKLQTPVVVLDQFEEMFTLEHNHAYWQSFFDELAQVLNEVKEGRLSIKLIISIREDFLGYLEKMASAIPSIFSNRFRLEALSKDDAQAAIEEPGKLEIPGVEFSSPKILFEREAMEELKDFLSLRMVEGKWTETNEVEPVQLQIICSELEERATEAKNLKNFSEYRVTKAELEGEQGLKRMLGTFYSKQLEKVQKERNLNATEMAAVRDLIEEELIVGNKRIPKDYEAILNEQKIAKETLDLLVKNKLLKVEKYQQSTLVELSHDTLVDPITKAYEIRKQQREFEKREAELLLSRKKIRKRYLIASLIFVSLLVIVLMYVNWVRSRQESLNDRQKVYEIAATTVKKTNPTLAFRIAMDGYAIDPSSGILDSLLSDFNEEENYYIQSYYKESGTILSANVSGGAVSITTPAGHYRYAADAQVEARLDFSTDTSLFLDNAIQQPLFLFLNSANQTIELVSENRRDQLTKYADSVPPLAISPDGTHCVIGNKLFSTGSQKLLTQFRNWAKAGELMDVRFSSDSKHVISFHQTGQILVQDLTGKTLVTFSNPNLSITTLDITSDLRWLVCTFSDDDGNPKLFDVEKSKQTDPVPQLSSSNATLELNGHIGSVTCFAISPDNRWIVTGGDDGLAFLWDFNGKLVSILSGHTGKLSYAGFTADLKNVITGSESGEVIVWVRGKPEQLLKENHLARFSPYDYASIGLKGYNFEKVYHPANIRELYEAVWSYESHLPKINYFPGDNTHKDILDSSVKELNAQYLHLLNHAAFASVFSKATRKYAHAGYKGFLQLKPALVKENKRFSTADDYALQASWMPWQAKVVLLDTTDYFGGFDLINGYYTMASFFFDSLKNRQAYPWIDSAKHLSNAFLKKFPEDVDLLNLARDVYLFSSVMQAARQDAERSLADASNAVSLAKKSVEKNPEDMSMQIGLLKAYLHAGRDDEAMVLYNRLKKMPEFEWRSLELTTYLSEVQQKEQNNTSIASFLDLVKK